MKTIAGGQQQQKVQCGRGLWWRAGEHAAPAVLVRVRGVCESPSFSSSCLCCAPCQQPPPLPGLGAPAAGQSVIRRSQPTTNHQPPTTTVQGGAPGQAVTMWGAGRQVGHAQQGSASPRRREREGRPPLPHLPRHGCCAHSHETHERARGHSGGTSSSMAPAAPYTCSTTTRAQTLGSFHTWALELPSSSLQPATPTTRPAASEPPPAHTHTHTHLRHGHVCCRHQLPACH